MQLRPTHDDCTAHRARLFRLSLEDDRAALEALVADGSVRDVYDTWADQLAELIATRSPAREHSPAELRAAVAATLGDRDPAREGVWAWYPWSRRLVHLLDEPDFVELRTSRNRYKITAHEQAVLAERRIGVVGLSVGQSVAVTVALERCAGALRLADFDHLGLSNLNRLRASVHEIGVPKVLITARQISEIDPFLRVECVFEGLTRDNLDAFFDADGGLDLVVDECDDLAMKFALRRHARARRVPVLMDTSDRGLLDVERFDREPDRPLFHGRVAEPSAERLQALTAAERVAFVAAIIGQESLSARATASLFEVGYTIATWPQLASGVALGGAVTCDAVRRVLLGELTTSGRYYVDLDAIVADGAGQHTEPAEVPASGAAVPVPDDLKARPTTIADLVAAAITAPSGGNCQPWQFVSAPPRLLVCHDRARSASLLDFEDTAAMAALGAAVENLVLAAHAGGLGVALQVLPYEPRRLDGRRRDRPATPSKETGGSPVPWERPRCDVVAVLDFAARPTETHDFDRLYAYVAERHTNRILGPRRPLPPASRDALCAAAASIPGARLQLIDDPASLAAAGDIIGGGDRVRFFNRRLHAEMMAELRWTPVEAAETRDGIDVDTLDLSPADRVGVQLCRSWPAMQALQEFGGGAVLARGSSQAVAAASAIGLLTMATSDAAAFFDGGRAMQRVWLTATGYGIAVQPLSSLPYLFARLLRGDGDGLPPKQRQELWRLRDRYAALFDVHPGAGEVLLMRLAMAPPATARALRRPVDAVLTGPDAEPVRPPRRIR